MHTTVKNLQMLLAFLVLTTIATSAWIVLHILPSHHDMYTQLEPPELVRAEYTGVSFVFVIA